MREQVNVIGCQTTHTDFFLFATSTGHHSSFTIQVRPFAFFFFSILKNFVFNGRASAVFAAFTEGGGEVRYVSLLATFIYMNIRVQLSGRSFDQQQPKSINPRICPVLSFPLPIYERRCCCPCRPHTQAKLVFFFLPSVYRREFRMSIVGNNSFCLLHFFSFFFPILVPFAEMARL